MLKKIKYPVSLAGFEEIRREGYAYVDKTGYVYELVSEGKYYFLSRPRRFGKSMLLNTLDAYFTGKKNLFKGLIIEQLMPGEWESFPILRLNLSGVSYSKEDSLTSYLNRELEKIERDFEVEHNEIPVEQRFNDLIENISKKTGKRVVVLIDEYDAPLTDTINQKELQLSYRELLHSFYTVLKKSEEHIRFCMLTGVTRYGKLSIFSGLNNLNDISFDDKFAGICGITEEELHEYYEEGIIKFAKVKGWSVKETYEKFKFYYDGYHFSESLQDIYNPYSINYALYKESIRNYWCDSGNPSILCKLLLSSDFDIEELQGKQVDSSFLSTLSVNAVNPTVLLFQTGYLTLKSYNDDEQLFTLGYPNREIEQGLLSNILNVYSDQSERVNSTMSDLRVAINEGKAELFVKILSSFLTAIPSKLKERVASYENYYHTIFYCILKLIGINVESEYNTCEGFIDMVIKTNKFIYVIELKVNGTALDAMNQIENKHYTAPFINDQRKLITIGLGFSKQTHQLDSIIIES